MGLAILIWGASNLAIGWCSGHFGLFGLTPQTVSYPSLNILGFFVAILSMFIFFFVKTKATEFDSEGRIKVS